MKFVFTLLTKYESEKIYSDIYRMDETQIYLESTSNKAVVPAGV